VLSISSSFVNELQADYSSIDSSLSLSDYTAGTAVTATFIVSADGYDQSGFNSLNGIVARPKKDRDLTQRGDGSFPALPSVYVGSPTASLLSTTPIQDGALSFRPVDDFTPDNIDAYTYFAHPTGLTYIDAIRYLPVTQSWMPAAPNVTSSGWIRSNSYNLGDVVLQPIGTKLYLSGSAYSSGSDLSRNGKYYICQPQTDRTSTFQSLHPPQLDGDNWVPLKYNSQWYQKLARFAYVGGDTDNVSLLKDTTFTGYDSIPKEYTRKHFRFFRDNSIGARRRTYEGTLNTATTTLDVGQPFEVFDINVQTIRVGGTDRASGGGGGTRDVGEDF
jgi:hypothetical protein